MPQLNRNDKYRSYRPTAIYHWIDDIGQTRYSWGANLKPRKGRAGEASWLPALANEYGCIILNPTFLVSRKEALAEARSITNNLLKGLEN